MLSFPPNCLAGNLTLNLDSAKYSYVSLVRMQQYNNSYTALGEGIGYPTPVFLGFPGGSASRESSCNAGDLGLIPGSGRSPGEGKGYPLQYSGLENSIDYIVHGVPKYQT